MQVKLQMPDSRGRSPSRLKAEWQTLRREPASTDFRPICLSDGHPQQTTRRNANIEMRCRKSGFQFSASGMGHPVRKNAGKQDQSKQRIARIAKAVIQDYS